MGQPVKERLNVLDDFSILNHLDRLEFQKKEGRNSFYTCPVCDGHRLSITPEGKFNCFSGECSSKDIMEQIKPLKEVIAEKLPAKATRWVKPLRPKATFEYFYPNINGENLVKVVISYPGDGGKKDVRQHWWNKTFWQPFGMPDEVKAQVRLYQIDQPVNRDAIATGKPIILGESESKIDLCLSMGLAATCNIGGSGDWESYGGKSNLYKLALMDAKIVLSPDRGKSGLAHCQRIAQDFPNAQWVYADPVNLKWEELNRAFYKIIKDEKGRWQVPKIFTDATPFWTENNLPQLSEDEQLWNWLDGDEYDLKNWIEDIADPILAHQMILDAIEPQRSYEIKKLEYSLFTSPVVSSNTPQNIDIESFVIGSFLLDNSLIDSILGSVITVEQFHHPSHRSICAVISELFNENQPVDVLSIHQRLDSKGLRNISQQELINCRDRAAAFADNDVMFQAKAIADKHLLRTGQNLGREVTKLFADESRDALEIVAEAERKILEFSTSRIAPNNIKKVSSVLQGHAQAIAKEKEENEGEVQTKYFKTGISEFDYRVRFPLGKLIGLIASPSHGKTTWAIQVCRVFALDSGLPTIFVSYEIGEVEAGLKHAVMETSFPFDQLRTQNFSNSKDKQYFERVIDAYDASSIYVYESSDSVEKLCANLRAFGRKHGQIGCVCIDYIQLVKSEKRFATAVENHDYVAEQLDAFRKESNCLMIWLIQPTKDVGVRQNKRPTFSDARGSSIYLQKVDGGFSLYRDERYNKNSYDRGKVEIVCEKYRDGEADWTIKVPFYGWKSQIGTDFVSIVGLKETEIPEQLAIQPAPQTVYKDKEEGGENGFF